ncbi:MAG TPA: M48 family metallopeptidase [Gemmatimonadaceae bacterium]|nr:M48 family metallopeptidase [Gemmatimonadaceae bacterium]
MKRLLAGLASTLLVAGCAVSTQQEVNLGAGYSAQINAQLPIIQDPAANLYLTALGDSIAHLADTRNLTWHFYLVDDTTINAFALPGGFIYVNRGLIAHATRLDELAGAMGHEIGHVTERHTVKTMKKQQGAEVGIVGLCVVLGSCDNPLAANAINVGTSAVFAKFSREDEAQADSDGVANVIRAGISPEGMVDLFRVLLNARQTAPSTVDAWFASHPMEEDRIAHVQALIATYDPAVLKGLTTNTPAYDAFRKHVMSLPHVARPDGK